MGLPIRICSNREMRELDQIAHEKYGMGPELLMENAGRAAVEVILNEYPRAGIDSEILVFAGKGNNAGDAFVVARRLHGLDRKIRVFTLVNPSEYRGATLKNFEIIQALGVKQTQLDNAADLESFFRSSQGPFLAIDGILGTGLSGDLQGIFYDVVEVMNQHLEELVALDIPTGVSGDTGRICGTSLVATLTISFGFPKMGHFLPPGAARRGRLFNVDLSLPARFSKEASNVLLTPRPLFALLKERDRYGHKNSFGHTLIIGGSVGKLGAAVLAARASHKMGTGLVTVTSWEETLDVLMAKLPDETMAVPLRLTPSDIQNYKDNVGQYSSIVVGPGLGTRSEARSVVQELLAVYDGPLVIDADALNIVAEYDLHSLLIKRRAPTVLTPHPGEMARLLKISKDEVLLDPARAVRDAAERTGAVVLLKGAATLIACSQSEVLYLNHYPNDGMATAGSGDVLAGMIGGLLGQKLQAFSATQLGVYLHSLAGAFAADLVGHRSMTARNIVENISHAFTQIKEVSEKPYCGVSHLL